MPRGKFRQFGKQGTRFLEQVLNNRSRERPEIPEDQIDLVENGELEGQETPGDPEPVIRKIVLSKEKKEPKASKSIEATKPRASIEAVSTSRKARASRRKPASTDDFSMPDPREES